MSFSAFHVDKRSEYKVKKHKSVKAVKTATIIDDENTIFSHSEKLSEIISVDNKDKVRIVIYDKENNEKTLYISNVDIILL